jgi:hypothetical protein
VLTFSIPLTAIASVLKYKSPLQFNPEDARKNTDAKLDEVKAILSHLESKMKEREALEGDSKKDKRGAFRKVRVVICQMLTSDFGRYRFCWTTRDQAGNDVNNGWSVFKKLVISFLGAGGTSLCTLSPLTQTRNFSVQPIQFRKDIVTRSSLS